MPAARVAAVPGFCEKPGFLYLYCSLRIAPMTAYFPQSPLTKMNHFFV